MYSLKLCYINNNNKQNDIHIDIIKTKRLRSSCKGLDEYDQQIENY